jgi:hypothetical protein
VSRASRQWLGLPPAKPSAPRNSFGVGDDGVQVLTPEQAVAVPGERWIEGTPPREDASTRAPSPRQCRRSGRGHLLEDRESPLENLLGRRQAQPEVAVVVEALRGQDEPASSSTNSTSLHPEGVRTL